MNTPICPKCGGSLTLSIRDLYKIHLCDHKHGCWVQSEELDERLTQTMSRSVPQSPTSPRTKFPSPADPSIEMDVYTIEGIEIDVCPKTGGVWLDFDEIIPILQKNDRILLERRDRNSTNGGFTWLDFVATILSGISF